MLRIAIMQPYLFPYLGYFQLIHSADTFILYDQVNYIKKGWINRNRLLEIHRQPFYFTVPINKASSSQIIKDLAIHNHAWQKKLENAIYHNYKRSLYFEETYPLIECLIKLETDYIAPLNAKCILEIAGYLQIKTTILSGVDFSHLENKLKEEQNDTEQTTSDCLHPKTIKIKRIIEICKHYQADTYITPINGSFLYPKTCFMDAGISVNFLKMAAIRYSQLTPDFYENLSIIDVLMNCGRHETQQMLSQYSLV